jgi:hypothetical protein
MEKPHMVSPSVMMSLCSLTLEDEGGWSFPSLCLVIAADEIDL